MTTKPNSQAEMKAAAPNDTTEGDGDDDDVVGVLIYREVQLRKAESAVTAADERSASTHLRTSTRKRTPMKSQSIESLPSHQCNGTFSFSSVEEHRSKKKVVKNWRWYGCSADGCTNKVGGVCVKHGAKIKRCSSEGCTNQAKTGGVCIRHGAKVKLCNKEGCTNNSVKGGVCIKHGAKHKRCRVQGCTNQTKRGGLCIRHGAKAKRCSSEGCTNQVRCGGVCRRHGAYHNTNEAAFGSGFDMFNSTQSLLNQRALKQPQEMGKKETTSLER